MKVTEYILIILVIIFGGSFLFGVSYVCYLLLSGRMPIG
jgi:hypothetical protein